MAAFQIRQYPQLRRPALAVPIGLLLVLIVAYIDWVTGPEFVMGQLYLLPVALVTVLLGGRAGMATAVMTVIIWSVAELLGAVAYSHWGMALINGVMRLAYLALVVWLLAVWRGAGERLEAQVRERTAALETEIAERRQTEDALHALALKLSDAEEAERRRLAHDIHDSVGQSLTLLKLRLQSAITVPADDPEHHVRDGIEILDGAIKQTRTLMFELHPPMLDDLGIVPALRGLAKELGRQASVEIEIVEEGEGRRLPKPLAGYLFRSIKELLSNAVRHGHSTDIVVTLYWWPQRLRVTVDDNGDGFDPSAVRRGLGLAGIRERVATLGGSLSIESNPGQGTRAIIDVPVQ